MKRTTVLVILSALLVGIVAAGAGAPFKGYVPVKIEGDVPGGVGLDLQRGALGFSPDGLCFALRLGPAPHPVVYVDPKTGTGHSRWLPGRAGGWLAENVYAVFFRPEKESPRMYLPDYRQAAEMRSQQLGALSTAQQLAVAAWNYCDAISAGRDPVVPEYVASNAQELMDRTRECFASEDGETRPFVNSSLYALTKARDMYFLSENGHLYLGHQDNYPSPPEKVVFVSGADEVDLTPPDGYLPHHLSIDPYKGRALVLDTRGITIYDSATEKSWWFERPSPGERTCMSTAYLVPEADHIVIEFFQWAEDQTLPEPQWLELWTIDGRFVQALTLPSADTRPSIAAVYRSRELLVAEVSYDTADGCYTEYQAFLAKR